MRYRAEIDGLRAIAVIPVILFHAGFEIFSGGFVGVDVFFVISGYLITFILVKDIQTNSFSIIRFYERRARRILPALFFVIFSCLPFAWFWLLPQEMKSFSQSLVAVSVSASNILFWLTSGYFDTSSELKPLIHTWSLAVEEQYYVLFPLFLLLAWQLGKRRIIALLGVVTVMSLVAAQYGATRYPSLTFYLLLTRAWELMIGALVAFYYSERSIKEHKCWTSECGSIFGFAMIVYAVFAYNQQTPFPSFYSLTPTIGAALIIMFATDKTLIGKLLSCKFLVFVGVISYSAYLWHQPLLAFARQRSLTEPSFALSAMLVVAVVPLAYLTWRFVETPFRNANFYTRRQIFTLGLVLSVLFLAFGLIGHLTLGNFYRDNLKTDLNPLEYRVRANFGLHTDCDEYFTTSKNCRTTDSPEILIWGDSFAMHLMDGFLLSNPNLRAIQTTFSACGPFFDVAPVALGRAWAEKCIESNDRVRDLLKKTKSIKYVVLSSAFGQYIGDNARILTRDGRIIRGKKESYFYFERTLRQIYDLGMVPVVFSPPPQSGYNTGKCLLKAYYFNESNALCDFDVSIAKKHQKDVYKFLSLVSRDHKVVWLSDGICFNGKCKASDGDVFIYRDGGHLSHEGSAFLGKKMNFYKLITDGKILRHSGKEKDSNSCWSYSSPARWGQGLSLFSYESTNCH